MTTPIMPETEGAPAEALSEPDTGGRWRLTEHPLRRSLAGEAHARPFEVLPPPLRASHLAVLGAAAADRAHLEALCQRCNQLPPPPEAIHFAADFGAFRLRWERHTEFSTYTVYRFGRFDTPFTDPALHRLPADWLAALPGEVLVAVHLALDGQRRSAEELTEIFAGHSVIGCGVVGDAAEVLTDFHPHPDGFGRILLYDQHLTPGQAGRLMQRLTEIETYRMLALLTFPLARQIGPILSAMDDELAEINAAMAGPAGSESDRDLLARLTTLAARVEHQSAAHNFRFSAARAYHALVAKRIAELRESRIPGMQTIAEFMERRLEPAMKTCEYAADRQDALSRRIARAGALLRTRVDIALEEKNRALLRSMNKRAAVQLRLQQTVEGLSVVAISYYLLGLLGYLAKGAKAAGLHIDTDLTGLLGMPVILGLVVIGVRRLRHAIGGEKEES